MQGEKEKALAALECYLDLLGQSEKGSFRLKGNDFFDALEEYFAEVDIVTETPRIVITNNHIERLGGTYGQNCGVFTVFNTDFID